MYFRVLGPLEVVDGHRVVAVGGGRRRSLLAYLLIHANEVVQAERLIDELWDEEPPATAAKTVQVYVSQLRKAMRGESGRENGHLLTRGSGYVLQVAPGELDVEQFERLLRDGRRMLSGGDAERAARRLVDALTLWRGPPFSDFTYERFAQSEIARLDEMRLAAVESRIEAELALGEHTRLVGELEALVREHPLRDSFRALLMLALYRGGRQAEALAVYREASALVRDELGLDPSPELRGLEARIIEHDPDLALAPRKHPAVRAGSAAPRDGEERRRARAPRLVIAGALLLAVAAGAALWQRVGDDTGGRRAVALDLAANSVVAIDAARSRPQFALPLPGRPTDVAARDGTVWIATADSDALTAVDSRSRAITRTVPLPRAPDAIAAGDDGVWVAYASSGTLVRIDRGYAHVSKRVRYPRGPGGGPRRTGRANRARAALATAAGGVWIANGSDRLLRVDANSARVASVGVGSPVDDVVTTSDAVWAMSRRDATVVRVDPRSQELVDTIQITARRGARAPSPVAIAAQRDAVWVLNGTTATVTRIDPGSAAVTGTTLIGIDRVPQTIAAGHGVAWVANGDGTLTRVDARSRAARDVFIGESLGAVVADGTRLWATTSSLDQKLPGGVR